MSSQQFSEELEGLWSSNLLVGGEMSSFDHSLRWLIAIAIVLAVVGIVLSIIGSSPGGIVIGVIVVVGCALVWLREKRKRDRDVRSDSE